ncbi:(2Fe-2S)-binding protein [Streptomyces boninensis]|uniref:(2Fe-2S)-binding protein n=1 Tax=Streptomyces boninensis TaxID=2039455 RepID=UPI003B21E81F
MRSDWHHVDLASSLAAPGDSMTVVIGGWHIAIVREGVGEGELRAYHRRRPEREVECAVRAGVIFVKLGARDLETNFTPHSA